MAVPTAISNVTIFVNDIELSVPKGELIVESVKRLGLDIPVFCYHHRMKPVGMCRMCLIEVGTKMPDGTVRKMPKPQAACTLPASEGLVVYTDTDAIHRDRKGVLEFLLINHPLDCPICDRGGECPLQNNTLFYGSSTSRYVEIKRHAQKAFPLSQYVTLDLERCIQCGRCVRFTEEISGDAQLAFRFRGAQMQPSTFDMTNFGSKFSGNVIEICPVGALTSTKYRFRARPWDLQTDPGICTLCSNGCNVHIDHRLGKIVRVNGRTNELINEEWTCDKGKFGHDIYNENNRLTSVYMRIGDRLETTEWKKGLDLVKSAFFEKGSSAAALIGSMQSNEDIFALRTLFSEYVKSENTDYRWQKNLSTKVGLPPTTSIEELENSTHILVFGCPLEDELPMIYLRIRKAWFKHGAKVFVASDQINESESFATEFLRCAPGTLNSLAQYLSGKLPSADAAKITGVSAAKLESFLSQISTPDLKIVTSRNIVDRGGLEGLEALSETLKSPLNVYSIGANDQGAEELNFLPGPNGLNTLEILNGCISGSIKALWLAGVDPFDVIPDREFVRKALENVEFLVVQNFIQTEAMNYASVVLPQCAPAESDGTYTNCERRVQRMKAILPSKGDAKSGWSIASEILMRQFDQFSFYASEDVMNSIVKKHPLFEVADYSKLSAVGSRLVAHPVLEGAHG